MKLCVMLAIVALLTGCAAIDEYTHADIRKTTRFGTSVVWEGSGPNPMEATEAAPVCMYQTGGKNFVKNC